jgi:Fic family protein
MEQSINKWIWQHKDYPNFRYDKIKLQELINDIEYNRGILDGISRLFTQDDIRKIEIDTITDEAINTSLIEGEVFKRESVRSSVQKN